MNSHEMLRSYGDFFPGPSFYIANPVAIGAETVGYDDFGTFVSIFDNFEEGLTSQSRTASSVGQQQNSFPKQPTQPPLVEIDRDTKQVPEESVFPDFYH